MTITITDAHPVPEGRLLSDSNQGLLRQAYATMKPGQSFDWQHDNRHPYKVAQSLGARIKTRKLAAGGWRIWLVKPGPNK